MSVITEGETSDLLQTFRARPVAGVDGITPFIFKRLVKLIAPHLLWLYNLSPKLAVFQESWKVALVSPVPKKSDLHDTDLSR